MLISPDSASMGTLLIVQPPLVPPGFSVESGVRRDAQGRWFHEGVAIDNEAVAKAFDRWIDRAEDGRYILKNSVNWAYVDIEGPPFFVKHLSVGLDRVTLLLSDGTEEALLVDSLRQGPDGRLYCDVREGGFVAGFGQQATMQFEPLLDEDEDGLFVTIGSQKVRPALVAEPLVSSPPKG